MTTNHDPIETVVRRVAEGLKPCPFCGRSDGFLIKGPTCRAEDLYDPADRAFPFVLCHCGVYMSGDNWDHSCESAMKKWNTRATAEAIGQGGGG